MAGELPDGWTESLPSFEAGEKLATREASGKVLNAAAAALPELLGGDADLSSSTKTALKEESSFQGATGEGRNLHFGVREHAMGGIVNGIAYHGGVRAYASTFFVFSDYMRPSMRLAALSGLPAIYVFTHDSVGVGEDGPTHQPVEHLAALRSIPNLHVVRPADSSETGEAWRHALERTSGPTALVLTRQKIANLDREGRGAASELHRGAYVLSDAPGSGAPDAILIATGSEVTVALDAQKILEEGGVRCRVVSMPCWELFEAQDASYRETVLPADVTAPRLGRGRRQPGVGALPRRSRRVGRGGPLRRVGNPEASCSPSSESPRSGSRRRRGASSSRAREPRLPRRSASERDGRVSRRSARRAAEQALRRPGGRS